MFVAAAGAHDQIGSAPTNLLTIPVPLGVLNGDTLWMFYNGDSAAPTPSGWTLQETGIFGVDTLNLYSRTAASEPSGYSVDRVNTNLGVGVMGAYRNQAVIPPQTSPRQVINPPVPGPTDKTGALNNSNVAGSNPVGPADVIYVVLVAPSPSLSDKSTLAISSSGAQVLRHFETIDAQIGYPLPNEVDECLALFDEPIGAVAGEPPWSIDLVFQPNPPNSLGTRMDVAQIFKLASPVAATTGGFGDLGTSPGFMSL